MRLLPPCALRVLIISVDFIGCVVIWVINHATLYFVLATFASSALILLIPGRIRGCWVRVVLPRVSIPLIYTVRLSELAIYVAQIHRDTAFARPFVPANTRPHAQIPDNGTEPGRFVRSNRGDFNPSGCSRIRQRCFRGISVPLDCASITSDPTCCLSDLGL